MVDRPPQGARPARGGLQGAYGSLARARGLPGRFDAAADVIARKLTTRLARPMPRERALHHITEGLSIWLGVPPSDATLQAVAVASLDVAKRLYQVAAAGHGTVRIFIEDGWLK